MDFSKIVANVGRELSQAELVMVEIFNECMFEPWENELVRASYGGLSWSLPDDSYYCHMSFVYDNAGFVRCRGADLAARPDGSLRLITDDVRVYNPLVASEVTALKQRITNSIASRLVEVNNEASSESEETPDGEESDGAAIAEVEPELNGQKLKPKAERRKTKREHLKRLRQQSRSA